MNIEKEMLNDLFESFAALTAGKLQLVEKLGKKDNDAMEKYAAAALVSEVYNIMQWMTEMLKRMPVGYFEVADAEFIRIFEGTFDQVKKQVAIFEKNGMTKFSTSVENCCPKHNGKSHGH